MSATKYHSKPITGTGKVVSLRTDTSVPVRMAAKLLDDETRSVIQFATAKHAGVERAHAAPLARLHDRAWMTAELERALEQDRLVLHYQPQYAIGTQRVVAVEALVRLETESGELIGPNDFIELAEQTGQILQLGNWVIEEACQQLGRWQQAGLGMLRMAVNVSPCQLMANDFCAVVDASVANAGIRHSDLELEITECQLIENLPHVERTLRLLAAKGVRVALDDFGTGYSSLAYLLQLSISTVKVDRVFVNPIAEDARAGHIIKLIIAMAQELGLGLTAEGIETEAQYRFLLESGCQLGQGFGFARPQGAEAIEQFLFEAQSINRLDDSASISRTGPPQACRSHGTPYPD